MIVVMVGITVMAVVFPKYYFQVMDEIAKREIIHKMSMLKNGSQLSFSEKVSIFQDANSSNYTFMEKISEETYQEIVSYLEQEFFKVDESFSKNLMLFLDEVDTKVVNLEIYRNLFSLGNNKSFMIRNGRLFTEHFSLEFAIDYDTNKLILFDLYLYDSDFSYSSMNFKEKENLELLKKYANYLDLYPDMVIFYGTEGRYLHFSLNENIGERNFSGEEAIIERG